MRGISFCLKSCFWRIISKNERKKRVNLINSQQNIISGIKHEWIIICENLFFEKSNFSKFSSCLVIYLFLCDIFYVYSILNSISAYKITLFFSSIRDKYNHKWHNIDQYPTRKLENQYFTHFTNSTYLKIFNLLKYSQAWKVQIMKIRFSLFEESLEKNSKFLYILFLPLFLPYFAP